MQACDFFIERPERLVPSVNSGVFGFVFLWLFGVFWDHFSCLVLGNILVLVRPNS